MAAPDSSRATKAAAGPRTKPVRVRIEPRTGANESQVAAVKTAGVMPGSRHVATTLGEAVAAGATALLFDVGGQGVLVRRRIDNAWVEAGSLAGAEGKAAMEALRAFASVAGPAGGVEDGEFIMVAGAARRPCRVTARPASRGQQLLVVLGAELAPPERQGIAAVLGRIVPGFGGKSMSAATGPTGPVVTLDAGRERADRIASLPGLDRAQDLVAAAIRGRAGEIAMEAVAKQVAVHHEVDGVYRPAVTLDAEAGGGVLAVFKAAAGLDPAERKRRQVGRLQVIIDGKASPCTVTTQGVPNGERMLVAFEYGRPKLKTLADLGVPGPVAERLKEVLAFESGVLVVAAPKRGGLSTLFDRVVEAADRLLRDFVIFEDEAAPRGEIQNVRPFRWGGAAGGSPLETVERALREYPKVLLTCDLTDGELARRLVSLADEGMLVILGIRGGDACEAIANLVGLGVPAEHLGRVLLGAVGGRLVRRLCPQCREEYLPTIDELTRLKFDPAAVTTLYRAAAGGCAVCAETGYLGRTGVFEMAGGRTLAHYVAKAAEAGVLRQAAAKDGMKSLTSEARGLVAQGITSLAEYQRVFSKS